MKVLVIGAGYVGLVTSTCLAEMGGQVTCVDSNEEKIARLKEGVIPIFEPGLEPLVRRNLAEGRLHFGASIAKALPGVNVCFIAVGTPPDEDGSADLAHVIAVAREIGRHLTEYAVIVDKSTVPVGTAEKVASIIREELDKRDLKIACDVVSNPEFLKEGAAVKDFMSPDRIIIGTDSERARATLRNLYMPFVRNHDRFFFMGACEAEMTKYVANAMLATRISFINEISNLCDRLGVDVESVRIGIGSDPRIGYSFIYPGCGYGGSCFTKDLKALIHVARNERLTPLLLEAVERRNELQKGVLFEKITARFGQDLRGLSFGVWGLAFKPETDDIRGAPALVLLGQLLGAGASVKAYDPVAMGAVRQEISKRNLGPGSIQFAEHQYDAINGVDALVLVTEWRSFRSLDVDQLARGMKRKIIFDGRNQYRPQELRAQGFEYFGIGR